MDGSTTSTFKEVHCRRHPLLFGQTIGPYILNITESLARGFGTIKQVVKITDTLANCSDYTLLATVTWPGAI